ncbi:hypothetical protein ACKKBG_A21140 [Auxenochlorella protothecoides x Auxenochlorella symbiontica]
MEDTHHAHSSSMGWGDHDQLLGAGQATGRGFGGRHAVFSFKTSWRVLKIKLSTWKRRTESWFDELSISSRRRGGAPLLA